MSDLNQFEANWVKFMDQLQGRMLTQSRNGLFTYAALNLILADCIGFWDAKQSPGGRWLDDFEQRSPEQAALVREILVKDMKFKEEAGGANFGFLKYVVPVGSAAAGLILSRTMGAANAIQVVSTLAPAAVAYPLTSNILSTVQDTRKKTATQRYLSQLDKYKKSVESVLQSA